MRVDVIVVVTDVDKKGRTIQHRVPFQDVGRFILPEAVPALFAALQAKMEKEKEENGREGREAGPVEPPDADTDQADGPGVQQQAGNDPATERTEQGP